MVDRCLLGEGGSSKRTRCQTGCEKCWSRNKVGLCSDPGGIPSHRRRGYNSGVGKGLDKRRDGASLGFENGESGVCTGVIAGKEGRCLAI